MIKKKNVEGLDLTVFTKNGTLRRRKPKTNRDYFTSETEEVLISYIKSEDPAEKERLFSTKIEGTSYTLGSSFYKLAECITNTFNFTYAQQDTINIKDIEHEVVVKLISEFHNYKQSLGKAYSYFGTVAKRYLIQYNKKQYKLQKARKDLDDVDSDRKIQIAGQEELGNSDLSEFMQQFIVYMESTMDGPYNYKVKDKDGDWIETVVVFSEKDKEIVNCIISFFKNVKELEIFYKPAFYLEIRDRTNQKTLDITKVIKIMKHALKEQMSVFYLEGELDIF